MASSSHSSLSSLKQGLSTISEKKPPLAPSRMRLPLRKISNYMPAHPSPVTSQKPFTTHTLSNEDKENLSRTSSNMKVFKPRRGSYVVKPAPATSTSQILKPRRRASIATTFQSEPSSSMVTSPITRQNAPPRIRSDRIVGRKTVVWDTQRVWRATRLQSPLGQTKGSATMTSEATPVTAQRSSRFMGSPPSHAVGSWKPKLPTVVALQRKQLVWSPLKFKGAKAGRRSFV